MLFVFVNLDLDLIKLYFKLVDSLFLRDHVLEYGLLQQELLHFNALNIISLPYQLFLKRLNTQRSLYLVLLLR